MNTKIIGDYGEEKASQYLIKSGYTIIDRNWKTNEGEIDIIAMKAELIVFCEVKTSPNGTIDMIQKLLGQRKRERIVKTSKCFLLKHRQYNDRYIRYDVIIIDMPGFPDVYHIENAFSESL